MTMPASAEKLLRDVRVVVQDAEDLIKATSSDAGERTREARAKLAGALVVAKESLHQAESAAGNHLMRRDRFIRVHGYPTVGLAFAMGFVLGAALVQTCETRSNPFLPVRSIRMPSFLRRAGRR